LFLIHGNHNWITDSYLGYGYLGDYLASHGYVVVSVDENACNGLSNENDGRAVLLLENIRQLEAYNNEEGNPLHQKIDYGNLALAGHSRGGEAIATVPGAGLLPGQWEP
jgi:predicted dienelactone hydrolase